MPPARTDDSRSVKRDASPISRAPTGSSWTTWKIFFSRTGQKTVGVEKLIREIRADAVATANEIAGPNQRLSLLEARLLPDRFREDFFYLRGKGLPKRVEPADIRSWAEAQVKAALDQESAVRLPAPPWQVRGQRPLIDYLPHPASHTHARVYVAHNELYFFACRSGRAWRFAGRLVSRGTVAPGAPALDESCPLRSVRLSARRETEEHRLPTSGRAVQTDE